MDSSETMLAPLEMYEAADERIKRGNAPVEVKISAVLALARGGALELALHRFKDYGLGTLTRNEDALALRGRLYKDQARYCEGNARQIALANGAEAYHQAWRKTGGVYSAINAATLYVLKGDVENGHQIARETLKILDRQPPAQTPETLYYQYASRAEALLLLHQREQAEAIMHKAIACDRENYTAHAVTLKQFELIIDQQQGALDWLDALRPPLTCFYSGRMAQTPKNTAASVDVKLAIDAFLEANHIGTVCGALAAGSDILFAEAALAKGARLRVILPCDPVEFERHSVTPFGGEWRARFERCLMQATSVYQATVDDSLADECTLELAGRLAMGQAIEDAELLATRPIQVLIQPKPNSLTKTFESIWKASHKNLKSHTINSHEQADDHQQILHNSYQKSNRCLAAMLFADLTGFGELGDAAVVRVVRHILDSFSGLLHIKNWLHLNSWGDGIFVASNTPDDVLQLAMNLQAKMRDLDLSVYDLPQTLALRVGLHYGPVTRMHDPITRRESIFGAQVAHAARIEPLAVPGAILASEAYISALALDKPSTVSSRYIGRKKLKGQDTPVRLFAINGYYAQSPKEQ